MPRIDPELRPHSRPFEAQAEERKIEIRLTNRVDILADCQGYSFAEFQADPDDGSGAQLPRSVGATEPWMATYALRPV